VITHEHPSVDQPTSALAGLRQGMEKEPPVVIIQEDVIAAIPPSHDMIKRTRKLHSHTSGHE
jgi:hypothetical protein